MNSICSFYSFKNNYITSYNYNNYNLNSKFNELINNYPKFKILSFGNDDMEIGNSSIWLLNKLRISKLTKLANPGGIAVGKCKV